MNYYSRIYKDDEKLVGIIAVDPQGSLYYVGRKELVKPFDAFFAKHKTLYIQQKRDKVYYRKQVEPTSQESWLNEFRRQMPAPYYGGPVELTGGFLESTANIWQQIGDSNGKFEERRY